MQPPLPIGTLLQNRYRITQILGNGGFARTYVVEDLSRFLQLCVLKEYIPNTNDPYFLAKSKELFQREAQILYQIDHPQIPHFLATFEQGHRLFLVQDYIPGKSYRQLQKERQEMGKNFTESEIVEFLEQMLSILEYIHNKGIIHRDISPDNIICRESDNRPILIDFGAVKNIGLQLNETSDPPTTVGKLGYAPREQLQTGQIYPSSDLYALGVTCVVLMTGRNPQELFDDQTMSWRWHQWIPQLSSWCASILNRMMSPRPNSRYQSAREVCQALRSLKGLLNLSDVSLKPPLISPQKHPLNLPKKNTHSLITLFTTPLKNDPKTLGVAIGLVILAISIGPLFVITSLIEYFTGSSLHSSPHSQLHIPSNPPLNSPEQILNLKPGIIYLLKGHLITPQSILYKFSIKSEQFLSISLENSNIEMKLLNINKTPLNPQTKRILRWEGILSQDGDYYLQLTPLKGVSESDYEVKITLTDSPYPSP